MQVSSYSNIIYFEDTIFSPAYILAFLVTDLIAYMNVSLCLGFLSCFIHLYVCFCASTILFWLL